MIRKIEAIVKESCKKSGWKYQYNHFKMVRNYALLLSKKYNANKKVVELAALLHDIGRIKYGPRRHAMTSAIEAEKILKKFNYDKEIVKKVKGCILSHRHSSTRRTESLEAKIVKDADALSHFATVPLLLTIAVSQNKNEA